MKQKRFSYYDIEQFLREAGAERINEKAVRTFEEELEDTVKDLVEEAEVYARYAGRKQVINSSDISMAASWKPRRVHIKKVRGRRSVRINVQRHSSPVLDFTGTIASPVRVRET